MAKRDSRYKDGGYRLQSWGPDFVVADDTDNGYGGRDKEFGIRFDDRVSFHANEHADGTIRIHFHTREVQQCFEEDRGSYWKFPVKSVPVDWPGYMLAKSQFFYNLNR